METQDLTLAQAARAVGLHVETMRRLAREGRIETYRVNPGAGVARFRVTPAALQAFRERGTRHSMREQQQKEVTATVEADAAETSFSAAGVAPGSLSGAEIVALWEQKSLFKVWEPRKAQVGPGKRFTDSSEYARHIREQAQRQVRE